MKRTIITVLLLLVSVFICTLGGCQGSAPNLVDLTQGARLAIQQADPAGQITKVQGQLAEKQQQLDAAKLSAATQPAEAANVSQLQTEVGILKLQLKAMPNADQVAKLNQLLGTASAGAAIIQPVLSSKDPADLLDNLSKVASVVPNYGWAIGMGLTTLAAFLRNQKAKDNEKAAISIAQSLQVATAAGQATVNAQGLTTFDHIQTPTAKALIDQFQKDNNLPSLSDLPTAKPTA